MIRKNTRPCTRGNYMTLLLEVTIARGVLPPDRRLETLIHFTNIHCMNEFILFDVIFNFHYKTLYFYRSLIRGVQCLQINTTAYILFATTKVLLFGMFCTHEKFRTTSFKLLQCCLANLNFKGISFLAPL